MTDRQVFNKAFEQTINDRQKQSTYEFTNQYGITSEITIDMMNSPTIGLGIKLTGEGVNVEKFEKVLAIDSNDLYKHYDNMLRATVCTIALEDLRPENF